MLVGSVKLTSEINIPVLSPATPMPDTRPKLLSGKQNLIFLSRQRFQLPADFPCPINLPGYSFLAAKYRSASMAAAQPNPAAVTA
jgi:hypothetical protein